MINANGAVEASWFSLPEFNKGWNEPVNFGSGFYKHKEQIRYCNYFNDTIFQFNKLEMYPHIVVTPSEPLSTKEIELAQKEMFKDKLHGIGYIGRYNKHYGVSYYLENETLIYFKYHKGMRVTTILHNKKTGETTPCVLKNNMAPSQFIASFSTSTDDCFVYYHHRWSDFQNCRERLNNEKAQLSKADLKVLRDTKVSDNPVLFLYKLKP